MNPFEEKLTQFVEDEVMFNAVKGLLLSFCDLNGAAKKISYVENKDDALLGSIMRAWGEARKTIELGFKDLEKYRKRAENIKDDINPAV